MSIFLTSTLALALAGLAAASDRSDKRGLCFIPNADHVQDNKIWIQEGSDLTWYYNYQELPSPAFSEKPQDEFEFIPMMWGANAENPEDTTFLSSVRDLIEQGTDIKHALGFNEPDADHTWGGSDIKPEIAARAWVANFEPLGEMGVKLGLPSCTGRPEGFDWLKQFLGNCSSILSKGQDKKKNCTWDFVPVHWYDNFGGLQSHIKERHDEWPDKEVWITEYAYAHQEVGPTQDFYNQSIEYFDKTDYIGRYTYFGAFRSYTSNVGPNAVFLNNEGELTDVGSWYLGFGATGVDPMSGDPAKDSAAGLAAEPKTLAALSGVAAALVLALI
jgi:hypothetical protein